MTISTVMDVLTGMLVLGAKVSTPIMGIGIVIGLIIAIFMAATQLQEQSLQFVPKIIAIGMTLLVVGPWMLDIFVTYTIDIFERIATMAPGQL